MGFIPERLLMMLMRRKETKAKEIMNYENLINEILTKRLKQLGSINNSCPNRSVTLFMASFGQFHSRLQ